MSSVILKVRLIVQFRESVLLLQQTSRNGGKFTLIGGRVEEGEYPLQALIRESEEEAGIWLEEGDLSLIHIMHKLETREVVLFFKAEKWKGEAISREPKKFKKVAWFRLDELPVNLVREAGVVLEKYLEGISYTELKDAKRKAK